MTKLRQMEMLRKQLAQKQVLESQKDRPLRQPKRMLREARTPEQMERLKRLTMAKKIADLRRWRDQDKQRRMPAQRPKRQMMSRMLRTPLPDQIKVQEMREMRMKQARQERLPRVQPKVQATRLLANIRDR